MRYALMDPIRGIAAFWVFCFHYHFSPAFRTACPSLHSVFKIGHLGVPMFFVVSGYCIAAAARSAVKNDLPWSQFLWRRMKRIYPPFWCSIAVVVLIPFIIEFISSLKTGKYVSPTAQGADYGFLAYGPNDWGLVATLTKVFQPVPEARGLDEKFAGINAVYWTLAIEVQFYLVVTVMLLLTPKHFYQSVACVSIASAASWFVPGIEMTGIFLPYWIMFAFGVFLYGLAERRFTIELLAGRGHLAIAVAAGLGFAVGLVLWATSGRPIDHVLFAGLFALLLFVWTGVDQVYATNFEKSSSRAVRWTTGTAAALGAMSYSLYLLHGRLQFLVAQFVRQVVAVDTILFDLAVLVGTCLAVYAFYWLCERPFIGTARVKREKSTA